MCRITLSAVLVAGLSAVFWSLPEANAQGAAPSAAAATLKRQPSSADTYLLGYLTMLDGDKLRTKSDFVKAYYKYLDARDTFDAVHVGDPAWNSEIVAYRRQRIRETMEEMRRAEIRRRAESGELSPQGSAPPDAQETRPAVDLAGIGLRELDWMKYLNKAFQPESAGPGDRNVESRVPEGGAAAANPTAGAADTVPPAEAPMPVLQDSVLEGNLYTLSFATVAGFSYQLESSVDLDVWEPQGAAVAGDGAVKSLSTEVTGEGRRFFRIRGTMTGTR